ncbi:MAG: ABC transporter substrate-binding protein [Burkholderiales bacterium]|nr:ABC transporter substrate-binding protein [Burkholderiales bacterium]
MKLLAACLFGLAIIAPATSSAETGVSPNAVLLGQSVALTGPAAALGTDMRMGAKVYFDHVNSKGGVYGRKIELLTLDDGYEPARTVPNTKKLIEEEKVFALFGYVGTPTSAAALPIFTQARVPFFGPFTGAELLRDPFNSYIFNVRASYYDETEKIVEQLVSTGAKNIAVFYQNDAYGQAGLKGVERAMARRNLKISATGTVERNTVNVAAATRTIGAAKPDAVVMISAYKSCGEFIRQMKKAGSAAQFYNVSFVGSQALADNLDRDGVGVAISQVMPFPWGASVPVVKEYQQLMRKAGQKDFTFTSVEGYVAAKIFVEGLRRTGKDLSREKFITALESMNDVDVGGFFVGFSPKNHNGSKYVDLTIIARDSKFLR